MYGNVRYGWGGCGNGRKSRNGFDVGVTVALVDKMVIYCVMDSCGQVVLLVARYPRKEQRVEFQVIGHRNRRI